MPDIKNILSQIDLPCIDMEICEDYFEFLNTSVSNYSTSRLKNLKVCFVCKGNNLSCLDSGISENGEEVPEDAMVRNPIGGEATATETEEARADKFMETVCCKNHIHVECFEFLIKKSKKYCWKCASCII